MRRVGLATLLLIYVFVVGHFNFAIALATGSVLLTTYRKHDGELGKWFQTHG